MWSCGCKCFSGHRRQRRRRSLPTERTICVAGTTRSTCGDWKVLPGYLHDFWSLPAAIRAHTSPEACRDSESDAHALFWNFRFFHLRFGVPLPSCVKCRRFLVLEAMVPMGSLASSKFPQPCQPARAGRGCAQWSTSDKPARVTARSLGAALPSMSLDSYGHRSRSCTTLACRAQGARFSGRFLRVTHHGDHCAALLLAPSVAIATSSAWSPRDSATGVFSVSFFWKAPRSAEVWFVHTNSVDAIVRVSSVCFG